MYTKEFINVYKVTATFATLEEAKDSLIDDTRNSKYKKAVIYDHNNKIVYDHGKNI